MATTTNSTEPIGGRTLRSLRLSAGLTQNETARRAGISTTYLQRLEDGLIPRRGTALQRVIAVLGMTSEDGDDAE